jgi:hypothetical protein
MMESRGEVTALQLGPVVTTEWDLAPTGFQPPFTSGTLMSEVREAMLADRYQNRFLDAKAIAVHGHAVG